MLSAGVPAGGRARVRHGRPPGPGRAVLAAALLAAVGLAGCGGPRPSVPSPQLPPRSVGEPGVSEFAAGARPTNVVICVLDAARADHFGCYGYPRGTTPNIDLLAEESVVFESHFVSCPSTKPSTLSLFTGLHTDSHLITERGRLDERVFTLAKGLKAAGVRTAFFTSNIVASPESGVGNDFDEIFGKPPRGRGRGGGDPSDRDLWRTPEGLTEAFRRWLATEGQSPFLAYCHFLPPHNPYDAPDAAKRWFAEGDPPPVWSGPFEFAEAAPDRGNTPPYGLRQWADLYDANLLWADWGIGEVVRLLREQGLLDNTLLVVTSDHGEAFGEHGYLFHSRAVYDEFVHIPLLIRFPGRQRLVGRVGALTQTVDLLPTVCELCKADYPREGLQGKSLLPLLDGDEKSLRDHVFASSLERWPTYLVRDSQWSLMLFRGGELKALYDLQSDPEQTRNVIADHPEIAASMGAAFEEFARTQGRSAAELLAPREAAPESDQPQLSEEARRELEALGYLR